MAPGFDRAHDFQSPAFSPGIFAAAPLRPTIVAVSDRAAARPSVPVINQPRIRRHAPLLEGQHAFYFDVEFGALSQTVRHALSNKDRLREMAEQAHAHVMANHTPKAIARYIVQTVFDAGLIKSQAAMPRKS